MNPTKYAVLLKDNNGKLIANIENKVSNLSWEWNRVGGCGGCNMKVETEWDSALASSFAEDYQIDIYAPDLSGTSVLWYSGYIDRSKPTASSNNEFVTVNCLGFVNQLKRVTVEKKTYLGMELGAAVKDIVENFSTSITDITSTASDYDDSGFSADSLYFNESAFESIVKIASIAGRREWGVRADKSFFFLTRDDTTKHIYHIGEDFVTFSPAIDFNPIVTKMYFQGGNNFDATFTVTNKIATREQIVSNSAITTQSVAQQFGRTWLKDNGVAKRSYITRLISKDKKIESTIPLGRAAVNLKVGIRDEYDITTNLYDAGQKYDGGTETLQIEKIKYILTDDGINAQLSFSGKQPSLADDLNRLEFMITNERNI